MKAAAAVALAMFSYCAYMAARTQERAAEWFYLTQGAIGSTLSIAHLWSRHGNADPY